MFSCPAVEILFYLVLVGWAALLALVQVQYTLPKIIWIAALNRAGPSSNGCNGIQYVCLSFVFIYIYSIWPRNPTYTVSSDQTFAWFLCGDSDWKCYKNVLGFSFLPLQCHTFVILSRVDIITKKSIIATFREYMCSVRWRTTVSLSIFLSF